MSFQVFSFLSGLAYLAFCLLIAASGAWKKCLRDDASTLEQSTKGNGEPPVVLFLSCLLPLSSFLFIPCGTLPSLVPASIGALLVVGALAVTPCLHGWKWGRRQGYAPLCLGVSLAVIVRYAQERGVPGDLYALDAYVAMPVVGVAEGTGKLGFCILGAVSLFVLWRVLPERRLPEFGEKSLANGEAFLAALAAELWMLAAIAFWVCLFFPASFTLGGVSGIATLGGLALNALFFWAKVLAVEWLLEKLREKYPHAAPLPAVILLVALWGIGTWLLLDAAAG
jgi:hypothetical protein